jgi:hypothetical protein
MQDPPYLCGWGTPAIGVGCVILGTTAGHYEADVWAPGAATSRLAVDVTGRATFPGECCPVAYVPQHVQMSLSPAP